MLSLFTYLGLFTISHSIFLSYGFWVARQTDRMEIFGMSFSSLWTLWLVALAIATPVLAVGNVLISGAFYFGLKEYRSAWLVLLTFIGAQVIAYPLMTYLWFRELPFKGALVGALLMLSGLLVAYFWKD